MGRDETLAPRPRPGPIDGRISGHSAAAVGAEGTAGRQRGSAASGFGEGFTPVMSTGTRPPLQPSPLQPPRSRLTGASPGHSYTVKSPSSFSSSDEAESGTLGSSLCLWGEVGERGGQRDPRSRDSHPDGAGRGQSRGGAVPEGRRAVLVGCWDTQPWQLWQRRGCLLLHGEHLLLLVLVVVHLGALSQRLVPRLQREQRQREGSAPQSRVPSQQGPVGNTSQPTTAAYRDLVVGQRAGHSLRRVVRFLCQPNLLLQPDRRRGQRWQEQLQRGAGALPPRSLFCAMAQEKSQPPPFCRPWHTWSWR